MHVNVDSNKIEIDIPEANEWVERIAKTAFEICKIRQYNRIKVNDCRFC